MEKRTGKVRSPLKPRWVVLAVVLVLVLVLEGARRKHVVVALRDPVLRKRSGAGNSGPRPPESDDDDHNHHHHHHFHASVHHPPLGGSNVMKRNGEPTGVSATKAVDRRHNHQYGDGSGRTPDEGGHHHNQQHRNSKKHKGEEKDEKKKKKKEKEKEKEKEKNSTQAKETVKDKHRQGYQNKNKQRPRNGNSDAQKQEVVSPHRYRNESFVIMAMPRSGSTYLQTMLDSHPDLLVFGEIFHTSAKFFQTIHPIRSDAGMEAYANMFVEDHKQLCEYGFCYPPDAQLYNHRSFGHGTWRTAAAQHKEDTSAEQLCPVCSSREADQARVVGFKALTGASISRDSQVGVAGNALKDRKIVVLKRRNLLLRAFSTVAMVEAKAHILRDPSTISKAQAETQQAKIMTPVPINSPEKLVQRVSTSLKEDSEMEAQARGLSSNVITVWYEDLVADEGKWGRQGSWRRLQEFLAVPHHPMSTPLLKVHNVNENLLTQYPDLPEALNVACSPRVYSRLKRNGATPDRVGCDGSLDALIGRGNSRQQQ